MSPADYSKNVSLPFTQNCGTVPFGLPVISLLLAAVRLSLSFDNTSRINLLLLNSSPYISALKDEVLRRGGRINLSCASAFSVMRARFPSIQFIISFRSLCRSLLATSSSTFSELFVLISSKNRFPISDSSFWLYILHR